MNARQIVCDQSTLCDAYAACLASPMTPDLAQEVRASAGTGSRMGEGEMKILEHGCRRSRQPDSSRPILVWDSALNERFERLYDEMIDGELRSRRRIRHRWALDDE